MTGGFAAFRDRNFRFYWIALALSASGTWIQIVAQSLLILQLSHGNAAALGIVALAQASAFFFFALIGGSFADHLDRRKLLLLTQVLLMLVAFAEGVLVATHVIQMWMIVVAGFLSGSALSFDQPARTAFLPSLVPERDLMSAVGLQSTIFTGAAALAPLLGGLWVQRFGFAGSFFVNSASYIAVIAALVALPRNPQASRQPGKAIAFGRVSDSVHQVLMAVKKDSALTWAVAGYAVLLFTTPSMQILLPVLVERVLHASASVLGLLLAAFGVGSILGAILVTRIRVWTRVEVVYLACAALWVAAMWIVATGHQVTVYVVALFLVGAAQSAISVLTVTLMQTRVEKGMRGRVMSLQTLANMGLRPLGDFPLSLLMVGFGAPLVAGASAAVFGGYAVYVAATRRLRQLDF